MTSRHLLNSTTDHDTLRLRDTVRAIYEAVYPSEDWAPVGFEEAERFETVHYRQAVTAAERACGSIVANERARM